jgi:LysR family transcriptional regulator, low CO2-responsive transcriptional regulator
MTTNTRLRVFVAVAEHGSVRAAASALVVTESSVSSAVTALARDVGVPLLQPDGRGVRLTPAGLRYVEYARQILGLHAQAIVAAHSETEPEQGLIRLAAVTTAGEHVLPDLLASFREKHPLVDLHLEVRASNTLWQLLLHHEVDLIVAGRPPAALSTQVRATRSNTLVVVGAPHRSDDFDPRRATWLLREPGSGTRATCLGLLSTLEAKPPRLTLGSHGATVAAAVAGLGVTLVSEQAIAAQVHAGQLIILAVPGTPLEKPWHLVSATQSTASAELLVAHVQTHPEWG